MKAVFTLTPAESKRLIAKAVVKMPEVRAANERGYAIIAGGTTNAYVVQEMLGLQYQPHRYTVGISTSGFLCTTAAAARDPMPVIVRQGNVVAKTILEALGDFHTETVIIKGANAIDPEGNVGVITSGWDGGTVGTTWGIMTSTGLRYVVPVGLEKMVRSVKESVAAVGSKTYGYSMGANFGMFILTNALVVTEIEALKILANVETKHVASGGVGGSEGAVTLVSMGEEPDVKEAISIVEALKGEPPILAAKGNCQKCLYACRFQGMLEQDLPGWLKPSI